MRSKMSCFLLLVLFISASCNQTERVRLGAWDYDWMEQVKKDLNRGEESFMPAYDQLIREADTALKGGVYSVTFKEIIPPSGSKNDYMSMGPYWWPDPDQPDGLPYINRDGLVNPERNKLDRPQVGGMINSVNTLTLAWFFSGKNEYAEKATELLRVWFLDPETLMNPHLKFGQGIPGRTEGRGIGIIDTGGFHTLVDAIALLETSGVMTDDEKRGLREWFETYLNWLTESQLGIDEDNTLNNHATAYDVQVCGIALFLGRNDFVVRKVGEMKERRIDTQIEADGKQPRELTRTKAFGYSVGNLGNFFNAGEKGLKVGVDIFSYVNPEDGSIQKALDFLINYIGREQEWPYEQITSWNQVENSLGMLVRRAARIYQDESYQALWEETFSERLKRSRSLLVQPGL